MNPEDCPLLWALPVLDTLKNPEKKSLELRQRETAYHIDGAALRHALVSPDSPSHIPEHIQLPLHPRVPGEFPALKKQFIQQTAHASALKGDMEYTYLISPRAGLQPYIRQA